MKLSKGKNTTDVINWFEKIDKKHLHAFTIFNVKDFYPSTKETLLKNEVYFVVKHTDIPKKNFGVIFNARKSLLFHSNQPWIKRDSGSFDVVGIFMLPLLSKRYSSNNKGLYHDDGLSVFRSISKQHVEKQKYLNNFQKQRLTNNYKMQSENS